MNKPYKYFEFTEIFELQRGQRLVAQNQIEGEMPYISSTAINNGIDNYISPPENMVVHKNKMTIANSGSVGYLFYHNYEFVASDHVTVIWLKNIELTKYVAMFLKPIFEKLKYRYNFGREISNNRLIRERIFLPIDNENNPDFLYMEEYIKSLENKIHFKTIKTKNANNKQPINMTKWKEFSFVDKKLWTNIKHGQRLIESRRVKGEIPYYSASEFNNSLTDSIDNPLFIEKDCIVYSTFGTAFWVSGEFTTSDEIYSFYNPNLNKYNALFITTIMKQNQYKFKFGRKAFMNKFQYEILSLPATIDGFPDWDFMESYIKSLPYSDLI